jgi:uncharacterized protein YbjT (DUF2867 family)
MTTSDSALVLVVGASGRVGRAVVTELLRLDRSVRALVRRPPPTPFAAGVEVTVRDLTEPDSLTPALAGVEAVFLVWAAGPATVSDVVARLAGSVQRVVFLSSPHQTPHPFFRQPNPMAALHANIERELVTSGLPSVILRPGMFAANTVAWWAPEIRAGEVVRWPYGAVETAPIDERDIAAVAVRVLSEASLAGAELRPHGPGGPESRAAGCGHRRGARPAPGVPRALAGRLQARDGRQLAAVGRRDVARRVGGGGRASRVRDHDGGGPHRRARTLVPRLGRRAYRWPSERGRAGRYLTIVEGDAANAEWHHH